MWGGASGRGVPCALCEDRRTLLWFANQRAVEYHPTLFRSGAWDQPTHLVMDLDPPEGEGFTLAVQAARLVREVLAEVGLTGVVKTSGAKGVHVFVPVEATTEEVAAATRAVAARAERLDPALATTEYVREDRGGKVFLDSTRAGSATVVAAYSPRVRPGAPVSFPVGWDDLDRVTPRDFTVHTALRLLGDADPWTGGMAAPLPVPAGLVEEGPTIPIAPGPGQDAAKRRRRQAP